MHANQCECFVKKKPRYYYKLKEEDFTHSLTGIQLRRKKVIETYQPKPELYEFISLFLMLVLWKKVMHWVREI
jgi:hypothetical protein